MTEVFSYDGLNRLTDHGESGQSALTVSYDALGNITTKTGVEGTYTYGNDAGPHAMTGLNGQIYNYDDNGNNISGGGRSLVYSTFDKPTTITKGGNTVSFAYGADRSRYRRIDQDTNGTTTTRYVGNVEIIERPDGKQERKRYLVGVAIETGFYSGGTETRRETIYTLKDHLGSLDVIVDAAGLLEQKLSFGPWGQRRDASNWEEVEPVSSVLTMIDLGPSFDVSRTTRGFTGHEMVDSVGIVHMNGRIYDPFLGRFLQTDNYVQDPTNTQSHNRYSYVWNNPLNATDPSGEFVFTLIAMAIVAGKGLGAIAIGAIFAAAATLDALIAGASLSDAFLTGIISGISAGAFAGAGRGLGKLKDELGKYFLSVKMLAHGAIGGITSVLQGGKFGHGFASAAFTAGVTKYNNSEYFGGEGFSWQRVAVGAAIGGSASRLSGGKFANGAITGAFSQALNNEASEERAYREREYGKEVFELLDEWQQKQIEARQRAFDRKWEQDTKWSSLEVAGETLVSSLRENLSIDAGVEAAYGAGATVMGTTNLNGDLGYDVALSKGVILKPFGGLSAEVVNSNGQIRGFYQSLEFCAVGCISYSWNYQSISVGVAIGPYFGGSFTTGAKNDF